MRPVLYTQLLTISAGGWSGPGNPVVVAETLQCPIDPGMPGDVGVLPDELDSGFAVEVGAGADIFGAGVKMALERGGAAREMEAFEGIVGWAGLFHDQCCSSSIKLSVNSMEIYGVHLTILPVRLGAFFA